MSSALTITMSSAHSPTFHSLHLRHKSFTNRSFAFLPSQAVLRHKPSYVTMSRAHSPAFPSLHLRHNSFSNPFVALPTSQLILQPFCRFTYVTVILQPLRCFTYVIAHSPTLLSLLLRHRLFNYRHLACRPCLNITALTFFLVLLLFFFQKKNT